MKTKNSRGWKSDSLGRQDKTWNVRIILMKGQAEKELRKRGRQSELDQKVFGRKRNKEKRTQVQDKGVEWEGRGKRRRYWNTLWETRIYGHRKEFEAKIYTSSGEEITGGTRHDGHSQEKGKERESNPIPFVDCQDQEVSVSDGIVSSLLHVLPDWSEREVTRVQTHLLHLWLLLYFLFYFLSIILHVRPFLLWYVLRVHPKFCLAGQT